MTHLLGIDIGTTHIKVGLFNYEGQLMKSAIQQNVSFTDRQGHSYYDPEKLWNAVESSIKEITDAQLGEIRSIGITSMAESGLIMNKRTGEYQSYIVPWFDRRTEEIAKFLETEIDPKNHFKKTGLHPSYKYGLAKILWLKNDSVHMSKDSVWLSTADFIAYKLTGEIGTDYSLAARTYAFRIDTKEWDHSLIHHLGIDPSIFPEAKPSGVKIGETKENHFDRIGLAKGIPVAVSGHDHVCAALAVGAINPGIISNSIGTAETLVGILDQIHLGEEEYYSGFNFGCHVVPSRYFWMGSIQSSGGSVEWYRKQFSNEELTYADMEQLLREVKNVPTGILYYPYLAGIGAPNPNPRARGAFIGLTSAHTNAEMLRAIYEGTAYELKRLKKAVEELLELKITNMISVGGGTKNPDWMQIRADVTNCQLSIPSVKESSLLGAAMTAGLGCGVYETEQELLQVISRIDEEYIYPDEVSHLKYQEIFQGYLALQGALESYFRES